MTQGSVVELVPHGAPGGKEVIHERDEAVVVGSLDEMRQLVDNDVFV